MWVIDTVCVVWSIICVFVAAVNPAKAAELIKMTFEGQTSISPKNHVLNGGLVPLVRKVLLGGT